MKSLEKVTEIFLGADIDDEDFAENKEKLVEWEKSLDENRLFLSWRNHDITNEIVTKCKQSYKEFGLLLATNRQLTEMQRQSLWAKQDACAFLLSLADKDALGEIQKIESDIEKAINTFG